MNEQESEQPIRYALRLHERATRDINTIYVWLAENISLDNANQWRTGLRENIAGLAEFPRRCPLAPERFRREVRQLWYHRSGSRYNYRILFLIIGEEPDAQDAPKIIISRVLHTSARPLTRWQLREIETEI